MDVKDCPISTVYFVYAQHGKRAGYSHNKVEPRPATRL